MSNGKWKIFTGQMSFTAFHLMIRKQKSLLP